MKNLKYLLVSLFGFLILLNNVNASSVSIKSNYRTVTKGNSVTVTATVNSESPIVSIEGTLKCSGAGINTGVNMNFDDVSNSIKSKSFSISFRTKEAGSISCRVEGARLTNMSSGSWNNVSVNPISITVKNPAYIPPKVYSSNNNLNNLEIEGYTFSEGFSKDKKEYNVEVPNGTEKVKINATKEDSKSSITGDGEVNVTEGSNKIEVVVTAENGNKNTYIINVTVKELDPIEVEINGSKYNVIRKEGILEVPENYEKSSVKIGKEDTLCYKNLSTGNIIIGLKDSSGVSKFYNYDEKLGEYTLYNGYKIGGININILPLPNDNILPEGYSKRSFKYGEDKLEGYQYINKNVTYAADDKVRGNDFYLVYAINELSGDKGLYMYDKLENTLQRYNSTYVLAMQKKIDNTFLCLLISLGCLSFTIIIFSIILIKQRKERIKNVRGI